MKKIILIAAIAMLLVACPAFATPAPGVNSGKVAEIGIVESASSGGEGEPLKSANTGETGDIKSVPGIGEKKAESASVGAKGELAAISEELNSEVRNISELRGVIKAKRDALKAQAVSLRAELKTIRENNNRVRTAVHAFLAMENLTGGIGKNVSALARGFDNSVQAREQLEEKLQSRNSIIKTLLGGDETAANELAKELNITDEKLAELRSLGAQCNCSDDVKTELKSQIAEVEAEQARLKELVKAEKADKGWFGWLFK